MMAAWIWIDQCPQTAVLSRRHTLQRECSSDEAAHEAIVRSVDFTFVPAIDRNVVGSWKDQG